MSSFVLKILACFFMLIDHIGFVFFPNIDIIRAIGRLAYPIFAFQVTIGYSKTRSKEKYILRMILFTIVSQLPFYLLRKVSISNPTLMLNVGATLTCGLLAIYCLDKIRIPLLKYLGISLVILMSIVIPMDYSWYGVLMVLIFYIFRNDKIGICVFYSVLIPLYCFYKETSFYVPSLFALIPILLYNGEKGKSIKYLFYIFYPLHMLLLAYIKSIC